MYLRVCVHAWACPRVRSPPAAAEVRTPRTSGCRQLLPRGGRVPRHKARQSRRCCAPVRAPSTPPAGHLGTTSTARSQRRPLSSVGKPGVLILFPPPPQAALCESWCNVYLSQRPPPSPPVDILVGVVTPSLLQRYGSFQVPQYYCLHACIHTHIHTHILTHSLTQLTHSHTHSPTHLQMSTQKP